MKQNLKTTLWTGISTGGFILFMIALLGIGFHYTGGSSGTLNDIVDSNQVSFIRDTTGLLVTGLVFSALIMGLMLTKLIFVLMKKPFLEKISPKTWDLGLFIAMLITTILLIAGTSLFIDKTTFSNDLGSSKADAGTTFALFLFIFLPILLTPIPLLIKNKK